MDIMYSDELVCILHPNVKKGILIFTKPDTNVNVYESGLKTGKRLKEEGIDFGRSIYHPHIFFRAPYYPNTIDYSSTYTEILSLYGPDFNKENKIFIRVDPNKTYVFSSEIRTNFSPQFKFNSKEYIDDMNKEVNRSKKTLTKYLEILKENSKSIYTTYNLYTSRKNSFSTTYPYDCTPINRNSEILVSLEHLTPEYFV
jgi:hypothetical protein